jgi:peptidoglycan L-alanyl-D-glutamate endopeptidase CwlK
MTERTKKMIAELRPAARDAFTKMCAAIDVTLGDNLYIIFEGLRTRAKQEAYYAQGRETLEQVNEKRRAAGLYLLSNEKQNRKITWTLNSKHLDGLAMDILPVDGKGNPTWDLAHYRQQFETIRDAGRAAGLECGADWPDAQKDWPHYQVK